MLFECTNNKQTYTALIDKNTRKQNETKLISYHKGWHIDYYMISIFQECREKDITDTKSHFQDKK
jgi:hypothetical protein